MRAFIGELADTLAVASAFDSARSCIRLVGGGKKQRVKQRSLPVLTSRSPSSPSPVSFGARVPRSSPGLPLLPQALRIYLVVRYRAYQVGFLAAEFVDEACVACSPVIGGEPSGTVSAGLRPPPKTPQRDRDKDFIDSIVRLRDEFFAGTSGIECRINHSFVACA